MHSGSMLSRAAEMKASCKEVRKDLLVPSDWTAKYVLLNHGRWAKDTLMAQK